MFSTFINHFRTIIYDFPTQSGRKKPYAILGHFHCTELFSKVKSREIDKMGPKMLIFKKRGAKSLANHPD